MSVLPPLRAPTTDGAILSVPPLAEALNLIEENCDRKRRTGPDLLGRPWGEVRRLARAELLACCREYVGLPGPGAIGPLLLAGHQPELFHPGVWVKNFALAGLARRHGGVAVNLVVDNDTVKSTRLRLPARGDRWPSLRSLSFDRWQGEVPWEEYHLGDRQAFERFSEEAITLLTDWGIQPLLPSFWDEARRQLDERAGLLGESFAAARRSLERSWDCANAEVPLSRLCRGEGFALLAGALLADLPRFVAVYNAAVNEYRARHRIRSRHHPVPDLADEGGWIEAPLWSWTTTHPRRARLFARLRADRVELRAGETLWPSLPSPSTAPTAFIEAWRGLEASGLKVRSRALVTTMFARLFLSDLFIHGIGGGKYDELTNVLIERFWGVPAPRFLVLSATLLLPLPTYPATPERQRRQLQHLRDLRFNPQRHLSSGQADAMVGLIHEKAALIAAMPDSRGARRSRNRRLRALNEAILEGMADEYQQTSDAFEHTSHELRANAVLRRRDFAFCLYPEAILRPFCSGFL